MKARIQRRTLSRVALSRFVVLLHLVNGLVVNGDGKLNTVGVGRLSARFRSPTKPRHPNRKLAATLNGGGNLNIEIHKESKVVITEENALTGLALRTLIHPYCNAVGIILLSKIHSRNDLRESGTHKLV